MSTRLTVADAMLLYLEFFGYDQVKTFSQTALKDGFPPAPKCGRPGRCTFNGLMDKYKPRYFVHGHIHMTYGQDIPRLSSYGDTQVINAYESYTSTQMQPSGGTSAYRSSWLPWT